MILSAKSLHRYFKVKHQLIQVATLSCLSTSSRQSHDLKLTSIALFVVSGSIKRRFLNWLCQCLSSLNIIFSRFCPVEKCGVAPHCLYGDSLTLISVCLALKRKSPYYRSDVTPGLCYIVITWSTSGARLSREGRTLSEKRYSNFIPQFWIQSLAK